MFISLISVVQYFGTILRPTLSLDHRVTLLWGYSVSFAYEFSTTFCKSKKVNSIAGGASYFRVAMGIRLTPIYKSMHRANVQKASDSQETICMKK